MSEKLIANGPFANNPMSATLVGRAADGTIQDSGAEEYAYFRANAAIAKGEVVALNVTPAAGTPISVAKMATADDPRLMVGVAVAAAAAGSVVQVCLRGIVELFVNAQTVAYGDVALVPGTNAGEASCSNTDPDATVIVGRVVGTVLAAKASGTNLALCYVKQV